jgi:hypothetical protein
MKPTQGAAAGTTQARACGTRTLQFESKASPSPARCDLCTLGFTKDYGASQNHDAQRGDPRGVVLLRLARSTRRAAVRARPSTPLFGAPFNAP